MASYDEGLAIKKANRAASRFMKSAFGVETTGGPDRAKAAEQLRRDVEEALQPRSVIE